MGELTAEQAAVVERPADSQTVVVAGPGTGKTHVLAARVEALLDRGELDDPADVLVLSFTRAAVQVLRERLSDHAIARLVRPSTIDSYARRLVRDRSGGTGGGFDDIIVEATSLVEEDPSSATFAHIVVDEAQDLGGARLQLIERLLSAAGGFTVLGDPAQAIYGWQDRSTRTDALTAIIDRFPGAARLELTEDRRTRTPRASPLGASHAQVSAGADEEALIGLRQALRTAPLLEPGALTLVLRNADAGTAVVCRTNADVLRLSQRLRDADAVHRIQPAAETVAPPAWVAELLADWPDDTLAFDDLMDIESSLGGDGRRLAWQELVRVAGAPDGTVDVSRVRTGAADLAQLTGMRWDVPLLSTVHRIKGLEFDRVIVTESDERRGDADPAEESRVLFVAATRARDETVLARLDRPDFAIRMRAGRWVASPWRRDTPTAIEIRVGDIDRSAPFTDEGSAAYVQRHLRTRVKAGDRVTVEPRTAHGQTDLVVMHKGLAIGRLREAASESVQQIAMTAVHLTGLTVDRLSTAVGAPEVSEAMEAGRGGFWLVPEIAGLARLG